MHKLVRLAVVGVVALLGACGESEGSGPVPKEQLPARIADMFCDGLAGCCHDGGFEFDTATCKSVLRGRFERSLAELGPNTDYDAEAAGQCLDAAAARSVCGSLEQSAPACDRVFRGRLPLGAECQDSDECRVEGDERVLCNSPDGVSPGVCELDTSVSLVRGKKGETCAGTCGESSGCDYGPGPGGTVELRLCYREDGLFCDYQSSACQSLIPIGLACDAFDECVGDAFCDRVTGVCTAPRPNGAACDGDAQCQSGNCADGSDIPEPGMGPIAVCVDRRSVTAEMCMVDFDDDGDEAEPAPPAGP